MILRRFENAPVIYTRLHLAKDFLDNFPKLYLFALKLLPRTHASRNQLINKHTEIVIEGFPRSANSFAHQAFVRAQKRDVIAATHVHSSAQVIEACKRRIPTLVLIREPRAAVVSLKALSLQRANGSENIKRLPIGLAINSYINFYTRVYPYRQDFVLGRFASVITDFAKIIREINDKFRTSFEVFDHTAVNVREIFESATYHLSPSPKRDEYKVWVETEIAETQNARLLRRAREIYERLVGNYTYLAK